MLKDIVEFLFRAEVMWDDCNGRPESWLGFKGEGSHVPFVLDVVWPETWVPTRESRVLRLKREEGEGSREGKWRGEDWKLRRREGERVLKTEERSGVVTEGGDVEEPKSAEEEERNVASTRSKTKICVKTIIGDG